MKVNEPRRLNYEFPELLKITGFTHCQNDTFQYHIYKYILRYKFLNVKRETLKGLEQSFKDLSPNSVDSEPVAVG